LPVVDCFLLWSVSVRRAIGAMRNV
jgi:hypothetical protein